MQINKTWQKIKVKRISPKKLAKILKSDSPYVLDVRPQNFKRDNTFLSGSNHYPLVLLSDRYREIPEDQPLIVTDWAMKQSPAAAKFLTSKGYMVLGVLKGGIERWKADNLPVEEKKLTPKTASLN